MLGLTPDGRQAVLVYFLTGRSENSRNRVFADEGPLLKTRAQDPAKLSDPTLVIYTALRVFENKIVVTNGDHTDSICEGFRRGGSFEQVMHSRCYEPDAPHFTPRISGLITVEESRLHYKFSILKKGNGADCQRFFYYYTEPRPGEGHLLHTYMGDGDPLPVFRGEPFCLPTGDDIDDFARELWASLDEENRVALHVRYISLGEYPRMRSLTLDRFGGRAAASM
jgi:hypothetical protein